MNRPASHLLSAALLLALSCAPSLAADKTPDIALKAKYTEVNVSFDDAIKSDPALLKYLSTNAKAWAAKTLKELVKDRKELGDVDADVRTRAWDSQRDYTQDALIAERYASIIRSDYSYTGGAHPNHGSDTLLWDRQAAKMISIRPFFTELKDNGPAMKAIRDAVVADLKLEKKKRDPDEPDMSLVDALEPKLLKIGPVSLTRSTTPGKSSGLTFHYSPYVVGSYAEGDYDAFVPWETLRPYLSPEGAAIFAGERPRDAGDKPQ